MTVMAQQFAAELPEHEVPEGFALPEVEQRVQRLSTALAWFEG
jgi:hypothetical protein